MGPLRADLTVKEVPSPAGLWCKSGHVAPKEFRRDGPDKPAEDTKFFQVSSKSHTDANGVYCELCLIVANVVARDQRPTK